MIYTQAQWLLFFFLYCFLGWIWECLYVSALEKHWVNRGFLYGPMIPIYGFGAITVLVITLPVRDSIPLIFLFGMIGATALEYLTGDVMEYLFHVRYWDYSSHRFNLNGYICLFSSLGWGLFSVLMVKLMHLPFEEWILKIPQGAASFFSTVLVGVFAVDATKSVQSALDLRELLKELSESNAVLSSLESRLENVSESIVRNSENFRTHMLEIESEIEENRKLLMHKAELSSTLHKAALFDKLKERRGHKAQRLALLKKKTEAFIAELNTLTDSGLSPAENTKFSSYRKELCEFSARLEHIEHSLKARRLKEYQKAIGMIRRNPSATSQKFKESFHELKSFYTQCDNRKK